MPSAQAQSDAPGPSWGFLNSRILLFYTQIIPSFFLTYGRDGGCVLVLVPVFTRDAE